jgi:hypothetical protein
MHGSYRVCYRRTAAPILSSTGEEFYHRAASCLAEWRLHAPVTEKGSKEKMLTTESTEKGKRGSISHRFRRFVELERIGVDRCASVAKVRVAPGSTGHRYTSMATEGRGSCSGLRAEQRPDLSGVSGLLYPFSSIAGIRSRKCSGR